MELYKLVEVEWEQHLAQNPPEKLAAVEKQAAGGEMGQ
jgi:hypothetical protein